MDPVLEELFLDVTELDDIWELDGGGCRLQVCQVYHPVTEDFFLGVISFGCYLKIILKLNLLSFFILLYSKVFCLKLKILITTELIGFWIAGKHSIGPVMVFCYLILGHGMVLSYFLLKIKETHCWFFSLTLIIDKV